MLYTGKGDAGTTKLFTTKAGVRLPKDSPVFEALGTVDELNTTIGWCRCACVVDWMVGSSTMSEILLNVQNNLFVIQAELAGAGKCIQESDIKDMEHSIASIESRLEKIDSFFVPGGTELSARLDIARAVSRCAERRCISAKLLSECSLTYMNRLSSLLYALVRLVNSETNTQEQAPSY